MIKSMTFIVFILGVIVGILVRDIKHEVTTQKLKTILPSNKAQFIDPVSFKEKFDKSNKITDLLDE